MPARQFCARPATAFFEMIGDQVELTILSCEPENAQRVFRSRARVLLWPGHTMAVGEDEDSGATRFVSAASATWSRCGSIPDRR